MIFNLRSVPSLPCVWFGNVAYCFGVMFRTVGPELCTGCFRRPLAAQSLNSVIDRDNQPQLVAAPPSPPPCRLLQNRRLLCSPTRKQVPAAKFTACNLTCKLLAYRTRSRAHSALPSWNIRSLLSRTKFSVAHPLPVALEAEVVAADAFGPLPTIEIPLRREPGNDHSPCIQSPASLDLSSRKLLLCSQVPLSPLSKRNQRWRT